MQLRDLKSMAMASTLGLWEKHGFERTRKSNRDFSRWVGDAWNHHQEGLGIFSYKRTESEGLVSKEAIVPRCWRREMWIFAIKRVLNGQIPQYKDYEDDVSSVRHLSANRSKDELTLEWNFHFVTFLHWVTDPY